MVILAGFWSFCQKWLKLVVLVKLVKMAIFDLFDHFGLGVLLLGAIWPKWSKMAIFDLVNFDHFWSNLGLTRFGQNRVILVILINLVIWLEPWAFSDQRLVKFERLGPGSNSG